MEYAIAIENVSKKLGDFSMDNISFHLEFGQILGLIGKNGAGKTTLLKLILGILKKDQGIISTIPKQDIGVVIGEHVYYENLTCLEMAKILSHFYVQWKWDDYAKYMNEFDLPEKKRIEELSKGMKVKFSLVCALSHQAQMLILDEPTAGLDPSARYKLLEELDKISKSHKISILFTSHISSDIELIADKIVYIRSGKLVDFIEVADISEKYISIISDNYDVACTLETPDRIFAKKGENWISVVKREHIQDYSNNPHVKLEKATLDDIICFMNEE